MWRRAGSIPHYSKLLLAGRHINAGTTASNVLEHISCGKTARADLCGGRRVTGVPTAPSKQESSSSKGLELRI